MTAIAAPPPRMEESFPPKERWERGLDFHRLVKASLLMESPRIASADVKPFILKDLFNIGQWQENLSWQPFAEGVEVHWIYRETDGPAAALLKYRPGSTIPAHDHLGFEHILVLAGSQRDENALLEAGTLMVHPPGTSHSVASEGGCIVLAIYERRAPILTTAP